MNYHSLYRRKNAISIVGFSFLNLIYLFEKLKINFVTSLKVFVLSVQADIIQRTPFEVSF